MKKLEFRYLIAALLVLFFCSPGSAQEERPKPKDDLPPLVLPTIEGEKPEESQPIEREDIPEPPKPLPLPQGPPKVKAELQPTGKKFFKLLYNGQLVGYSSFYVSGQMSLGGKTFSILQSEGMTKLGFGEVAPSTFFSKLMVEKNTLRPSYYKCMQKTGGASMQVECVYSETMVAQTNRAGDSKTVHIHNYEGEPPSLLFNNLWGHIDTFPEHYWILVRSAVEGGIIPAYDPILRGGGQLVIYEPKAEKWELDGRQIDTKVYPISDLQGTLMARVRVKADNLDLLEVEEIGSGLTMIRSNPAIAAKAEKIKGLDLTPDRIVQSNVVFNNPQNLTSLEAEVEINLRGGQFADHRIPGYRQYFTGELRQGYMKGRVVVRSVPREASYFTKYPMKIDLPSEVADYVKAGPGAESEFPPLQIKARELAWKSSTTFEAARRLNNFASQIEEGVSLPSARYALESEVANPESKALLLIAMARSIGIPARPVGGLLFRDGSFVPHHWAELWLGPQESWAPFDPTTGESGRVGATHLALWESGDVQKVAIKVTDYAPRAAAKVPYFATELNWTVGEKRVYSIFRDGQKIGQEVVQIKDLVVEEGSEAYRFAATSEISEGEGKSRTTVDGLINTNGLPLNLNYSSGRSFQFLTDTMRVAQEGEPAREFPYPKGTYLTDPQLLTQWAMVVGQLPQSEEKEFTVYVFLPDRLKSQELILEVVDKEPVLMGDGQEIQAQRIETDNGMVFFLNEQKQVVKIAVPDQNLELMLDKVENEALTGQS